MTIPQIPTLASLLLVLLTLFNPSGPLMAEGDLQLVDVVTSEYQVDGTIEIGGMPEIMVGKYYYPLGGEDLGVVVIAHADGANHLSYDGLATSLAESGFFVASIDRIILDSLDDGVIQFYDLLQFHLKYLFQEFNNETLSTHQFPIKDIASPTILSHQVLLLGHSAGGRATFYSGRSAVTDLRGLQLKAILGIAPTLGTLDGQIPNLDNLPTFIIQGNADADNVIIGFEEVHFNYSNIATAKVGLLEDPNNSERAYILVSGSHLIQNQDDVVAYAVFIARAFLGGDRSAFDEYIRYQSTPYANPVNGVETYSNILYWNDGDQKVFRASTGVIPAGWNHSTLITTNLSLAKAPAQTQLGTPDDTKTLHFSKTLKVGRSSRGGQTPPLKNTQRLKFLFNQSVTGASYLRFNACQLFFFEYQGHSNEGIDPLIRLIYAGEGSPTSEWRSLSHVDERVVTADLVLIDRNIMKTYVLSLDAFLEGPVGTAIAGIEFDLTDALGTKKLMLDDMAFME